MTETNEIPTPDAVPAASPEQSLAERMYPAMNPPKHLSAANPIAAAVDAFTGDGEEVALEVDAPEPTGPGEKPLDDPGGYVPDYAGGYDQSIQYLFDEVDREALYQGDKEGHQAVLAGLAESKQVLHEWGVPGEHAREIGISLSAWRSRELTDDQVEDMGARTSARLQKEWGSSFRTNLAAAQTAYKAAAERLPWLKDLMARGAGNDPELIRHFARIGLRQARKAAR